MMDDLGESQPLGKWQRIALLLIAYALLLAVGLAFGDTVRNWIIPAETGPSRGAMIGLGLALLLYVITSALPFVPGAEIGFGLMMVFGSAVAPLVYLGMVAALLLAYTFGRLIPPVVLARVLEYFGLRKSAGLITTLSQMSDAEREAQLALLLSGPRLRHLVKWRYILLVAALNIPGNSVIGGGGGIAFAAGASRAYTPTYTAAAILIAVAPIPVLFLFT